MCRGNSSFGAPAGRICLLYSSLTNKHTHTQMHRHPHARTHARTRPLRNTHIYTQTHTNTDRQRQTDTPTYTQDSRGQPGPRKRTQIDERRDGAYARFGGKTIILYDIDFITHCNSHSALPGIFPPSTQNPSRLSIIHPTEHDPDVQPIEYVTFSTLIRGLMFTASISVKFSLFRYN